MKNDEENNTEDFQFALRDSVLYLRLGFCPGGSSNVSRGFEVERFVLRNQLGAKAGVITRSARHHKQALGHKNQGGRWKSYQRGDNAAEWKLRHSFQR